MKTPNELLPPGIIYNQSINGFVARLNLPIDNPLEIKRMITYAFSFLIVGISTLVLFMSNRTRTEILNFGIMIALPAIYLIAPFSWQHHLVYMLPSILFLFMIDHGFKRVLHKLIYFGLLIGSALMLAGAHYFWYNFIWVGIIWLLCVLACFWHGFRLKNETIH